MQKKLGDISMSPDQIDGIERNLHAQHLARRERCGHRLGMSTEAINQMVTEFMASHGGATVCPPAYATTSCQYSRGRASH